MSRREEGSVPVAQAAPFECTEATPWQRQPGRVRHHGASEVGEQENGWPGGDTVQMRCRFCSHTWTMELPQ